MPDLVIITGMSGSGKRPRSRRLKTGFYAVDNLPISLVPKFADLSRDTKSRRRAALIIDIREGEVLQQFPKMYPGLKKRLDVQRCCFSTPTTRFCRRRFSETQAAASAWGGSDRLEQIRKTSAKQLKPIRRPGGSLHRYVEAERARASSADYWAISRTRRTRKKIVVYVNSFGFRHGVPPDSDLVFDVRFLPNPELYSGVQEAHRPASERGAIHPLFSANGRIHQSNFRTAHLSAAALYTRGKKLFDDFIWLHRGPPSLGPDCK